MRADLDTERGRASITRAICALANSNISSRSYIVFGVSDGSRTICGLEPIDDQRFQQLVRNTLTPPPRVIYDNVILPGDATKVVGLLTIHPSEKKTRISRNTWKLRAGDAYYRCGSETLREGDEMPSSNSYEPELASLEGRAAASLEVILRDVVEFHAQTSPEYHPRFRVFHDRYAVCYSGYPELGSIEAEAWAILAGEGIRLFWGALQYVEFNSGENSFAITENIALFWREERFFVPIEKTTFVFLPDGSYLHEREFVFEIPDVSQGEIDLLMESYRSDLEAYKTKGLHEMMAFPRFEIYSHELLLAYLNGELLARDYLLNYLDGMTDGCVAESQSEAIGFLKRIEIGLKK